MDCQNGECTQLGSSIFKEIVFLLKYLNSLKLDHNYLNTHVYKTRLNTHLNCIVTLLLRLLLIIRTASARYFLKLLLHIDSCAASTIKIIINATICHIVFMTCRANTYEIFSTLMIVLLRSPAVKCLCLDAHEMVVFQRHMVERSQYLTSTVRIESCCIANLLCVEQECFAVGLIQNADAFHCISVNSLLDKKSGVKLYTDSATYYKLVKKVPY